MKNHGYVYLNNSGHLRVLPSIHSNTESPLFSSQWRPEGLNGWLSHQEVPTRTEGATRSYLKVTGDSMGGPRQYEQLS